MRTKSEVSCCRRPPARFRRTQQGIDSGEAVCAAVALFAAATIATTADAVATHAAFSAGFGAAQ